MGVLDIIIECVVWSAAAKRGGREYKCPQKIEFGTWIIQVWVNALFADMEHLSKDWVQKIEAKEWECFALSSLKWMRYFRHRVSMLPHNIKSKETITQFIIISILHVWYNSTAILEWKKSNLRLIEIQHLELLEKFTYVDTLLDEMKLQTCFIQIVRTFYNEQKLVQELDVCWHEKLCSSLFCPTTDNLISFGLLPRRLSFSESESQWHHWWQQHRFRDFWRRRRRSGRPMHLRTADKK